MSKTNAIADKATDVLLNMVNVTIQTMSDVVEFGKQQIPEVIHQLLVWKAVSAGLWQLFSVCFMLITFIAVRNIVKAIKDKECLWSRDRYGEVSALPIVGLVVCAFFFFLGFVIFFSNFDWLKIIIAPKVYLIEFAADLIRSSQQK